MEQNWEEFTQKTSYRAEKLRVSLNARGQFMLSQKVVDTLGSPDSVIFLFDRASRNIGIKPSSPDVEHAYELKKQGNSQSYYISAKSFCSYYDIDIGDTVVFNDVEVEDDLIILNLNNVSELVRRARLAEFPVRLTERAAPAPAPAPKFTRFLSMRAPEGD
ncbi:MAG: hypothetical protein AB7Q37_04935 [Pyrinomonadaceae bacterium]